MRTRIIALVGMLVLSLVTSVTLAAKPGADPAANYADSTVTEFTDGTIRSGVIKKCTTGTLFKNVNPFISGGNLDPFPPDGVPWSEVFDVDGSQVELIVTWYEDNSFRYEFGPILKGLMEKVGVENNSDKIFYDYASPVSSDGNLNVLAGADPLPADKANHIDVCLLPLDTTPPTITFIRPPTPESGDTVSGTVTFKVTVSDPSGVDRNSITFSVNGGQPVPMNCTPQQQSQNQYECSYPLETELLSTGEYTATVSATDEAESDANTATESINVVVARLFTDCFGTLSDDDNDFADDPSEPVTGLAGGCKPTDLARIQTSPFTQNCDGNNPDYTCFLSGTLLKPDPAKILGLQSCGEYGFPDPRMAFVDDSDTRCSDPAGCWIPIDKRPLYVFTEIGIDPALAPGVLAAVQASYPDGLTPPVNLDNALVLDENTYCANGCCAFAQHVKGYETEVQGVPVTGTQLSILYPEWPPNALAFIKVHFPLLVLNDEDLVAKCYEEDTNPDLQKTGGAGYAPLFQSADDSGFLTVLTQTCKNPARTLSRNNGFDGSNLVVSTAGPGYVAVETSPVAVLDFMYQQNEEDFARVFSLLDIIDRDGLLLTGNLNSQVRSPVNQAKRRFDNFNPNSLQQSIDALGEAADGIRTQTTYMVTEANPPGEALSLIEHLIWDLGLLKRELERLEGLGIL